MRKINYSSNISKWSVVGSDTYNCEDSRDSTMLRILSEKGYFKFKNVKLKTL